MTFSLPYIKVFWWAFSLDWNKNCLLFTCVCMCHKFCIFYSLYQHQKRNTPGIRQKYWYHRKKKIIMHCFYIPVHDDINSNLQCRSSSQTAGTYTVWHQMQWASVLSSSACIYLMGIGRRASCTLYSSRFIQIHVHILFTCIIIITCDTIIPLKINTFWKFLFLLKEKFIL